VETKENWVKTIVVAIVVVAVVGVVWSWFMSCAGTTLMKDDASFLSVLPFGIALGVLLAAVGVYLRTVPFKLVTGSLPFDNRETFLFKLDRALQKAGYVPKAESESDSDDLRVFECAQSLDSLYKRNITVELGDDTASLVGPKASLKRVRKALQGGGSP
jgi:hypothetical protein